MDLPQIIRRTSMFSSLTPDEAKDFAQRCRAHVIVTGEQLFVEGDPADYLYVIVSGELVISCKSPTGDDVVVGRAGPGSVLGEMAVLEVSARSATATATSPVTALLIASEEFGRLIEVGHPAAGRVLAEIRRTLVARLRAGNTRLDALFEPEFELGADLSAAEAEEVPAPVSPLRALWQALMGGDR